MMPGENTSALWANPWAMHYQSVWRERAADRAARPDLPDWIRVASLAMGCHRANGHANFASGEIAEILGTPGQPLSPSAVSNAIRLAKQAGWIAAESFARCLVVPPHAVEGGLGGPNQRCSANHSRRYGLTVVEGLVHAAREKRPILFTSHVN